MEHPNMCPDDSHTNPQLRDGFYRLDHPDSDLFLSDALQRTYMDRMDDHGKLMREIADKPNQPNVASKPAEPCQSGKSDCHTCTRHPERSCNCPNGECADDGDDWVRDFTTRAYAHYERIDRERNAKYVGKHFPVLDVPKHGGFECPVDGKACGSESCCGGICKESWARATLGTDWSDAKAADDNRNTAIQTGDA